MTVDKAIEVIEQARVEYRNHSKHWYEFEDYTEAFTLAVQALNHMKIVHQMK